jgi:hypothetical protein
MKRCAAIVVFLAIASAPFAVVAGVPDFSGTWVLDPASVADARPGAANPNAAKVEIVIRQTKATLSVDRRSGDRVETASHNLDGTESVNKLPSGNEKKSRSSWVGSTLVTTSSTEMGGTIVPSTEVFSLSPDGKVLTIDVTMRMATREVKRKLVYRKK